MNLTNFKKSNIISRILLIFILTIVMTISTLPGYVSRTWSWLDLPKVANIHQIKNIQKTGLTIPGWKTVSIEAKNVGTKEWLFQTIEQNNDEKIMLLFLPQNYYLHKPEVEWVDVDGVERWKTDSYGKLKFTVTQAQGSGEVKTRIFRAWNSKQTFAVVQWYAWPNGGHYATLNWYWFDRLAQFKHQRLPWIAVCLKIPIEPLGDLQTAKPLMESVAKTVQSALNAEPFHSFL